MDTKELITAVEKRLPLWDQTCKQYHNREITNRLWNDVANELYSTSDKVKKKWKGLKDVYRRELKKVANARAEAIKEWQKTSHWAHFSDLKFMREQMFPRYTPESSKEARNLLPLEMTDSGSQSEQGAGKTAIVSGPQRTCVSESENMEVTGEVTARELSSPPVSNQEQLLASASGSALACTPETENMELAGVPKPSSATDREPPPIIAPEPLPAIAPEPPPASTPEPATIPLSDCPTEAVMFPGDLTLSAYQVSQASDPEPAAIPLSDCPSEAVMFPGDITLSAYEVPTASAPEPASMPLSDCPSEAVMFPADLTLSAYQVPSSCDVNGFPQLALQLETPRERAQRKYRTAHNRKLQCNSARLIQIEEQKLKMLKRTREQENAEYYYLLSFLPYIRRMSLKQKLKFRVDMQELLYETLCSEGVESRPDTSDYMM